MAFYDEKPSKLEAVGNGSFLYRFNIEEQTVQDAPHDPDTAEPLPRSQWKCDEVTVYAPLTANKITEAVIALICPASHEQKLVNEYNAARLGLVGGSEQSREAQKKINAYTAFLLRREEVKRQIDEDCSASGIIQA